MDNTLNLFYLYRESETYIKHDFVDIIFKLLKSFRDLGGMHTFPHVNTPVFLTLKSIIPLIYHLNTRFLFILAERIYATISKRTLIEKI